MKTFVQDNVMIISLLTIKNCFFSVLVELYLLVVCRLFLLLIDINRQFTFEMSIKSSLIQFKDAKCKTLLGASPH